MFISMLFYFFFAENTIFSFFTIIIDLYFLVPENFTQIFNATAELVIRKGKPIKKEK